MHLSCVCFGSIFFGFFLITKIHGSIWVSSWPNYRRSYSEKASTDFSAIYFEFYLFRGPILVLNWPNYRDCFYRMPQAGEAFTFREDPRGLGTSPTSSWPLDQRDGGWQRMSLWSQRHCLPNTIAAPLIIACDYMCVALSINFFRTVT